MIRGVIDASRAPASIKREMGNAKWTVGTIAYMCGFAYAISMIVYQLGGLVTGVAYNTVLATVTKWFPSRPGICSGILLTSFGFSFRANTVLSA